MTTICVISDTHENQRMIDRAVEMIKPLRPQLVIHCGDIISPPVLLSFDGLPMRFVYGNNDGERAGLRNCCRDMGFGEIDDTIEIELAGKRLYCYHGTVPRILAAAIDSQNYDYVFTGHTHETRNELVGKTRVVNPGALFSARIYTFAEVDLEGGSVTFHEVPRR